jgi:hypothetical protein
MNSEQRLLLNQGNRWNWFLLLATLAASVLPVLTSVGQDNSSPRNQKKLQKGTPTSSGNSVSTSPPQEVELARLEHHQQMLEASLGPLKTALSKLDDLAMYHARSRNYQAAIAVRTERERIATDLDRIAKEILLLDTRKRVIKTALLPDRILLSLPEARLDGVRFNEQTKSLTRWDRPGAYAEWTLPSLPPGGYEVLLTYQCNPLEGGTVLLNEKMFSLSGEMDTTLRGPEVKNLGTLKITDGSGPLRLTAKTIIKSNLMDLLAIELIPANR